jgi:hypothetical protein
MLRLIWIKTTEIELRRRKLLILYTQQDANTQDINQHKLYMSPIFALGKDIDEFEVI